MALKRRSKGDQASFFPGFTDIAEIGVGSLATVYRARESGTNRFVALKLLNVRGASVRAVDSFERESIALGAVSSHPNIVTLYRTFRAADGRPVIVLELCRGAINEGMRDGHGLPVPEVVSMGIKIAGALETAHRAEILHRDVKPQNILITEFGEPALADFGVAILQSSTQTTAGLFEFTTLHVAPELLEGGETSAATDVYELASSIYQLIASKSAFRAYDGESPASVILRILRDPVKPLVNANVPSQLSDLLIYAMSKDQSERPPTAAEFAAGLAAVEEQQGWPRTQFLIRDAGADREVGQPSVTRMPQFRPKGGPPVGFAVLDTWTDEPDPPPPVVVQPPPPVDEGAPPVVEQSAPSAPVEQARPVPAAEETPPAPPVVEQPPVAPTRSAIRIDDDEITSPFAPVPQVSTTPEAVAAPALRRPVRTVRPHHVPEPPPVVPPPPPFVPPPAAPLAPPVPPRVAPPVAPLAPPLPPRVAPPVAPLAPPVPPRVAPPVAPLAPPPLVYPIPPAASPQPAPPTERPLPTAPAVPTWSLRTPEPAAEPAPTPAPAHPESAAPQQFVSDITLDPMALRRRVTIRSGASALVVDEARILLRVWWRRTEISWPDILGFEPRFDGVSTSGSGGRLVALTVHGAVELPATKRSMSDLRYIHALLDAYLIRSHILASR